MRGNNTKGRDLKKLYWSQAQHCSALQKSQHCMNKILRKKCNRKKYDYNLMSHIFISVVSITLHINRGRFRIQ